MSILLQVEHLTVAYQALAVLRNVNLTLRHGEKVALVGANGSGKSSLLLHLSGCLTPRAGRILVEGESCIGQPRRAGRKMGLLFQRQECQLLLPSLREELALSLCDSPLDEAARQQQHQQIATTFGLLPLLDRPPHHLSGGEQQRAALATLLITHPALLLLDEPSAALDPQARRTKLEVDPCDRVKAPKVSKKPPVTMTIDQVNQLLKAPDRETVKGLRDAAMFELLYATGIKASELIALQVDDVNFAYNILTCRNAKKERVIPFGISARSVLSEYLESGRARMRSEERRVGKEC